MSKLSMIVAMANNRAIGQDNQLLWHLPEDFRYFKRVTMGKPIIMGRKTFESIGRPLPGRLNIVVTRQNDWQHEGVKVVHSLEGAIRLAEAQAMIDGADEVMLIGGAELYSAALNDTDIKVDLIYLTRVNTVVDGDVFFPDVDAQGWQEISRRSHSADENHVYDYAFCVLAK